jgi:hypothetical protein
MKVFLIGTLAALALLIGLVWTFGFNPFERGIVPGIFWTLALFISTMSGSFAFMCSGR